MDDTRTWLSALILLIGINYSHQACQPFTEIQEENYDRTYTAIGDANETTRPLGFVASTVVYQRAENPCFMIDEGEDGQYAEIKFETVPTMQLCIREKETAKVFCDNGRHSSCRTFTQSQMTYEPFCETSQGCAEADVNFWLRITKGPKPADDTEGMWCFDLKNEYPETLRPLPPNFTPKPTEETIDGATAPGVSLLVLSLTCLLAMCMYI